MPCHLLFLWAISCHQLLRALNPSAVGSCGCCREHRLAISPTQSLVYSHPPRILLLGGEYLFVEGRSGASHYTMRIWLVQSQAICARLSRQGTMIWDQMPLYLEQMGERCAMQVFGRVEARGIAAEALV